ncbi:hypothetical protein [Sphingobacterium bambusae]|uniref:Uncharacterized protein n=1 Tax=Sphingobacterium bambusae TaxID=662858 RepID=A0ABW6BHY8_9SPHI|nr:hypothetical protein [Sphingobacterium bambusae]WPL49070.1 hypothetical protein SCB77_01150 [Sphingobacterium bambusae]
MEPSQYIRFQRKNFGKSGSLATLFFCSVLFLLGVVGIVVDWKSGGTAAILVVLLYLLQRGHSTKRLLWLVGLAVFALYLISCVLPVDLLIAFVTALFLPFGFFLRSALKAYRAIHTVDVFYWDNKQLHCLVMLNDSDYKGYALNPEAYRKTYRSDQVTAVKVLKNNLLISVGDLLIRPLELTKDEVASVLDFVQRQFPQLLSQEAVLEAKIDEENRRYKQKIIPMVPIVLVAVLIYFFADNGRNQPLTYAGLALMLALPVVITILSRKK